MVTREAFLPQIPAGSVLHLDPKHALRLNHIEIWFLIIPCKLPRHGSFAARQDPKNGPRA
jgi:hypothetical protein